jgi:hypothetical protein
MGLSLKIVVCFSQPLHNDAPAELPHRLPVAIHLQQFRTNIN